MEISKAHRVLFLKGLSDWILDHPQKDSSQKSMTLNLQPTLFLFFSLTLILSYYYTYSSNLFLCSLIPKASGNPW